MGQKWTIFKSLLLLYMMTYRDQFVFWSKIVILNCCLVILV